MARRGNPVRMGPISIFVLVIIICLAVLAVLAFSTSRAQISIEERQQEITQATYDNEIAAQQFLAGLDTTLEAMREDHRAKNYAILHVTDHLVNLLQSACIIDSPNEAVAAVESAAKSRVTMMTQGTMSSVEIEDDETDSSITASGRFRGDVLRVEFTQDNRRTLSIAVRITDSLKLDVIEWKTSTIWQEDTSDKVWSG